MDIIDLILNAVIPLEIICALVGTYYFFKTRNRNLRIIVQYLWVVVLVETLGYYTRLNGGNNNYLYNFLSIFEFCVWSFVFYENILKSKKRIAVKILFSIGILGVLLEFILIGKFDPLIYLSYGITFIRFIIVIYCCIYIVSLVSNHKIAKLKSISLFWISIGLLTFNACIIPFNGLLNIMENDSHATELFFLIPSILSYGMYTFFILGFIWGQKNTL